MNPSTHFNLNVIRGVWFGDGGRDAKDGASRGFVGQRISTCYSRPRRGQQAFTLRHRLHESGWDGAWNHDNSWNSQAHDDDDDDDIESMSSTSCQLIFRFKS